MNVTELLEELEQNKAVFDMVLPFHFIMVGLPGCGKSTIINGIKKIIPDIFVASTDDIIEEYAIQNNLTYSQAFKQIDFKLVEKQFKLNLFNAHVAGKNIIVDQTNMSIKSRRSKINFDNINKICIDVKCDEEVRQSRLTKREKETGKYIPHFVSESMKNSYEIPTYSEGFHKIYFVES